MTGMEHAIERAASVIDKAMQSAEWRWAEDPDDAPTFLARALAEAGLIMSIPPHRNGDGESVEEAYQRGHEDGYWKGKMDRAEGDGRASRDE